MDGVNSYEQRIKNPGLDILDFEFLSIHPEAKLAIWQRYNTDVIFKSKIDMHLANNVYFRYLFKKHFSPYFTQNVELRR